MPIPDFVHLHVHSEYSLLDGANRIPRLVEACQEDEQGALALTDHGNMFGAVELYSACKRAGIKPLIGCEVYIAQRSMHEPHSTRRGNGYSHLTLLARDAQGYGNLMRLASAAYVDGYHVRPRIDWPLLEAHAQGINCLSGCLAGEVNQLFLRGREREAEDLAARLRDLFGRDHFWLELQRNGIDEQTTVNEALTRLHGRTGIPLVATNDVHYLRHEDCAAQDILLCINTGAKRDDEKRFRFETDSLFFRTREEMAAIFRDLPEALSATLDVAQQCQVELEFGKYHVPEFVSHTGESPDELFDRLLDEALVQRYGAQHSVARERLAHEKQVIRELGFVSYFLIVWDLIQWAREHDIPVGPGRGSAAGSIVAYLLDITRLDPLEYDLLFERFLNSSRVSMPDIDIDFCKEGRERVIQYTRERYGTENVTQIVTFGTMASRTVVRDVARVLDLPLRDVNRIAKKIPSGPGTPSLEESVAGDPELRALRESSPEWDELFRHSAPLEGLARHASTHAAGVVITPRPTVEYVPLARIGEDITTQYPAPTLEELGLLKMDYLGLRTLTIIQKCLANIERMGGSPPNVEDLPQDDPATWELLTMGDTLGVFQLESDGMRKLVARLKPDCFEDLIAVLALYRPGPLESGMADTFCDRKHGKEPITVAHPSLEPILEGTYGCIVYQEQVMLASMELAGFSPNDADNLRKAMGKKKPEIMQRFSAQFMQGAEANGCSRNKAAEIWDNIVKFGGYGFNKSHSAAYAVITYQTAYLKANFRTAFLAANLSCEMSDSDKVKDLLDGCRRSGIEVRPPCMQHSDWEFTPEDERAIRYGLGAVKGTGMRAIEALVAARERLRAEQKPLTFHSVCCEVAEPQDVGKLAWEALVKAGAFDFTGHDRGAVLATIERIMHEAGQAAADRRRGQASMFDAFDAETPATGSEALSEVDPAQAWDRSELLAAEYEVLGLYLSGHPLEERAGLVSLLSSCRIPDLAQLEDGAQVFIAGLVLNKSELIVRSGKSAGRKMCRARLEDLHGSAQLTVFPGLYEESREFFEDGAVVVAKARVENSGDESALLADELYPLERALPLFQGGLQLSLTRADEGLLPSLLATIKASRGPSPLYLSVAGGDGVLRRVRANRELAVQISEELVRDLGQILGADRVELVRL